MRVSNLLKLQEGKSYILSQRMFSGDYYFFILKRYFYERDEYSNENCIFHGSIVSKGDSHFNSTGLFIYIEEEGGVKYHELTGIAGSTFLKVDGRFSVYDFDFVGAYDEETYMADIKKYKSMDKINRKRRRTI